VWPTTKPFTLFIELAPDTNLVKSYDLRTKLAIGNSTVMMIDGSAGPSIFLAPFSFAISSN